MDEHDFSSRIDSITPSPVQLRALTHPIRLRLLGLLRIDGPQTASDLARKTGLNTGSTSYHLRMLAKNGFIEKDPDRSEGRKLFWKSSNIATVTGTPSRDDPDAQSKMDAMYGFQQMVAAEYSRQMLEVTSQWQSLSPEWQDASTFSDFPVRVNARQAREIVHKIGLLLLEEVRKHPLQNATGDQTTLQDDDSQAFTIQLLAFPLQAAMSSDLSGSDLPGNENSENER